MNLKKINPGNYVREDDLRQKFNCSVVRALGVQDMDYYGLLDFDSLLLLKSVLARIHDIVTLRLSQALVEWVTERFHLEASDCEALRKKVNETHTNTSGFDLACATPNLIGEVKGCMPVNGGETFGAAQINGLTNDVRQMLGHPARGKEKEKLSKNTKINREKREHAVKILGLYDSPSVRSATKKWSMNLMKSSTWEPLKAFTIQDIPQTGELSPDAVYLVYLTPLAGAARKHKS